MSKPMVPRRSAKQIGDDDYGADSGDLFVTASDAAKLEAVVEAAKEMRAEIVCHRCVTVIAPRSLCPCDGCASARAFDAARSAVEGERNP